MGMNNISKDEMYSDAIIRLLKAEPFFGYVLLRTTQVWAEKLGTLGVTYDKSGRFLLLIDPKFFRECTVNQRSALLKHEVLHLAFGHLIRGKGKNQRLFNLACDISINQMIDGLPKGGCHYKDFKLPANLGAEEYYELLIENATEIEAKLGKGKGDGLIDSHEEWDKIPEEVKEIAKARLEEIIVKSARQAEKIKGNLPANIEALIESICRQQKIPWNQILRQVVLKSFQTKYQFNHKKLDRRREVFPARKRNKMNKILIGLDTSGSISDKDLAEFFGEIDNIKRLGNANIRVAECDAKIGKVYDYKEAPKSVTGRGGTDFRPVFALADKDEKPDVLIYFTDGYGDAPAAKPKKYSVIWVFTKEHKPPCDWGYKIVKD